MLPPSISSAAISADQPARVAFPPPMAYRSARPERGVSLMSTLETGSAPVAPASPPPDGPLHSRPNGELPSKYGGSRLGRLVLFLMFVGVAAGRYIYVHGRQRTEPRQESGRLVSYAAQNMFVGACRNRNPNRSRPSCLPDAPSGTALSGSRSPTPRRWGSCCTPSSYPRLSRSIYP